ncbi:MAG TPA: VIT domain-containing protein [Tepidisphaeraceae bacterium]|jgi:Ca-activated chloride channel family protein|nr:VIT domain-containing protein [Tepidisphaeraceae bacterium]
MILSNPDRGRTRNGGAHRATLALLISLMAVVLAGCSARQAVAPASPERGSFSSAAEPSISDLVPPQSLPARDEELWIIEKASPKGIAAPAADAAGLAPGSGMLLNMHGAQLTPFPLEHTEIRADIRGCIASVSVRQRFANPSHEVADATYVFPLPQNAAVSEFVMTIGRRHIRGIVRERGEAEHIYRQARGLGFLALLIVQDGPDIFAQRVANIEPGRQIDVDICYFHTIPCRDGWFEFDFPLIAGPRGSGWPKAGQRGGRDVDLAVHIDAGAPLARVESPSHGLVLAAAADKTTSDITLAPADRIPNADFVLRYKLGEGPIRPLLFTEPDGDGGAFSVFLPPPGAPAGLPRRPLEMVFAIDSGTDAAGVLPVVRALRGLKPEDTFQIIHGAGSSPRSLTGGPVAATAENAARYADALARMRSTGAGAGEILRTALAAPHEDPRLRVVCLVTDGRSGTREALAASAELLGAARIVVIGVGRDPDKGAIEAIARMGRGPAVYPPAGEDPAAMMADLIEKLSHPALTDITIAPQGADISEVFPRRIADLVGGRALMVTGRYHGAPPVTLTVRGTTASGPREWTVSPGNGAPAGRSPVASVWARMKIADLASQAAYRPDPQLAEEIKQVALDHGLLSRYSAVICVDSLSGPSTPEESRPASAHPLAGAPK